MILFGSRPDNGREAFENKAAAHEEALVGIVLANGSPDRTAINAYLDTKCNHIWGDAKPFFMKGQHRKCGFCEVKITESTGDVEHYRPKNAVWHLKTRGRELEDVVNRRGRSYYKSYSSGYWWLAYSWDNYLVACPTCNRTWKSALFPVTKRRRRAPRRGDEDSEEPLLLDPFGDRDPAEHLEFGDFGQVEPHSGSTIGEKTIETCGLDRESLRSSREEKATRAHRLVRRLKRAIDRKQRREILFDIEEMGGGEYQHAGMVRAIFEQGTGLKWTIFPASP